MKSNRLAYTTAIWILGLMFVPAAVRAQSATPTDNVQETVALPAAIPIFPLPDPMLFPNGARPLHIFESRYRAMVADALKGDRIIGMVTLRPGYEADYEGRPPIYPIGCAGLIADVQELPDGRFNILLRALVKFRVTGEDQSRPYRLARVEAMPEQFTDEDRAALRKMRQRLERLLVAAAAGTQPPPAALPDEVLVNAMAQYLDLDPADRQDLLERNGALSRAQGLIDLVDVKPPR